MMMAVIGWEIQGSGGWPGAGPPRAAELDGKRRRGKLKGRRRKVTHFLVAACAAVLWLVLSTGLAVGELLHLSLPKWKDMKGHVFKCLLKSGPP